MTLVSPYDGDPFMTEESALALIQDERRHNLILGAAFKTVDIFSGITKKRLFLKDGEAGTDLHQITVPFDSPELYREVERQISHILFQTDPVAKKMFIDEYTKRVSKVLKTHGVELEDRQVSQLHEGLDDIINITENHRVESLWGLIYPGSYKLMREKGRRETEPILPTSHDSGIGAFYGVLETGLDPEPGKLDRYRPYCIEALRKVEKRGFAATLMVSKWLIANLVSEIIREMKDEPPAEPPKDMPNTMEDQDDADQDQEDGDRDSEGKGQEDSEEPQDDAGGDKDESDDKEDGDSKDDQDGSRGNQDNSLWDPPPVDATQDQRSQALQKLTEMLGSLPQQMRDRANDVKQPRVQERGQAKKAAEAASDALKMDIHDAQQVNDCLDKSQKDMADIVKAVMAQLGATVNHDDWIRKEADAKVVFKDVKKRDVEGIKALPLSQQDLRTIRRLQAIFNRVMGRRRTELDFQGVELDVSAYIESKMTGHPLPCFKQEAMGRGFKCLVMIDRSGSMGGEKSQQAERASRIIARALKYPFVDLHIWGWNSLDSGQIDIARFDPKLEIFDSAKSRVGGVTPLHLAVRIGARFMEQGAEVKHIIVATDGQPMFARRDGQYYGSAQLKAFTRQEVRKARKKGINITGVIIDNGWHSISDKEMRFMFGNKRYWRRMTDERFGQDMITLVTSSFMSYLRNG